MDHNVKAVSNAVTAVDAVVAAIPTSLFDLCALESSVGFKRSSNLQLDVFEFIVGELDAVGGNALLEVDDDGLFCVWNPPPAGPGMDGRRMLYLSHMLQAGLMAMPSVMVANTAYAGMGVMLSRAFLMFNQLNPYVAERDSKLLTEAMPLSSQAWLAHGIILMDNGKFEDASRALVDSAMLDKSNHLVFRCLAVCMTGLCPKTAVKAAEDMLSRLAKEGNPPGLSHRVTYGFALLSARMKLEAKVQFEAAGLPMPKMTVRQWREWGSKLEETVLPEALGNPKKFAPQKG